MDANTVDTMVTLLAAWLLIAAVAFWAQREKLGLSRRMMMASLRGLIQLLVLAFVLHWIFDIQSRPAQALLIIGFCILAGHNSASHYDGALRTWIASVAGLICACLFTLPWLAITGAIDNDTRTLIPLGSMIAANGMNAISLMLARLKSGGDIGSSLNMALIPTVDTLRLVGLVHMPGVFVGMILAGATAVQAAVAQLVVLYMIVASCFVACLVSFLWLNHYKKATFE